MRANCFPRLTEAKPPHRTVTIQPPVSERLPEGQQVWRVVRVAAGLPGLRLHDLRHSFASVGLARGDALPIIGAILGHADVKTTSRYAHLADDPVRNAADQISETISTAIKGKPSAEVVKLRG